MYINLCKKYDLVCKAFNKFQSFTKHLFYFQNNAGKSCERIITSDENCDDYISTLSTSSEFKTEKCSKDELIFDQSVVLTSVTIDYGFTCKESVLKQGISIARNILARSF